MQARHMCVKVKAPHSPSWPAFSHMMRLLASRSFASSSFCFCTISLRSTTVMTRKLSKSQILQKLYVISPALGNGWLDSSFCNTIDLVFLHLSSTFCTLSSLRSLAVFLCFT